MEEIYNKINNGEININYLSPIDLVNLEIYLESINLNLNNLLKNVKITNNKLLHKKHDIEQELSLYVLENDISQ